MGSYDPFVFARLGVNEFDAVIGAHRAAMNCHDCEEVLQRGIGAFRWLERAEETVVQAENDCLAPYSPEAHAAIEELYRLLTRQMGVADAHARQVIAGGFTPDNLAEFHDCQARAKAWVDTQAAIHAATLPHESLTEYARHAAR